MYLLVQEQEETNSALMRFETRLSAHRARVLNWALSHLFLFACLNWELYLFVQMTRRRARFGVSVRDTRLSACAPNMAHMYSVQLFRIFCLNALNSIECLKWQG